MTPTLKTARLIGGLILISFVLGIIINLFLLGPVIFVDDFLTKISANSNQVITATLLGLVSGAVVIGIAALLLPYFKQENISLAYLYLAFSIINFAMILIDNVSILALLGLSNEYIIAAAAEIGHYESLGTILYHTRWWTHYMTLLLAAFPLFIFYYLLYSTKLIPTFISIWGLIGVILLLAEVLLSMFDRGISMNLFLPLGLNQLFLAVWLLSKGFKNSKV